MTATFYDILGLPIGADSDAIHAAYRRQAKLLHPDVGGDAEAFKRLGEAYATLKDPAKRAIYHALLSARPRTEGPRLASPVEMWLNIATAVCFVVVAIACLGAGPISDGKSINGYEIGCAVSLILAWRIWLDRRLQFKNPLVSLWEGGIALLIWYIGLWIMLIQFVLGIGVLWVVYIGVRWVWRQFHG